MKKKNPVLSGKALDQRSPKERFVRALAEFLISSQAGKSIAMELELKFPPVHGIMWAREWAALRNTTPLFGYPTVEEAEKALTEFLK